jgi:hypothetical protein
MATLSLGTVACKKDGDGGPALGTHTSEMAAQPLEGDPQLIREDLRVTLLPLIAPKVPAGAGVQVSVGVDPQGTKFFCSYRTSGAKKDLKCPDFQLPTIKSGASDRHFLVSFGAEDVERARQPGIKDDLKTHMAEMAPAPAPSPGDPPPRPHSPKKMEVPEPDKK